MLIVRVARDATRITELEAEVRKFLGELESKVEQLQKVKL
jgi:hypothetical protein